MARAGHQAEAAAASLPDEGRPRSLRDQHHELTRELIMRAVIDQVEQGGFSELTVPEVARAAGVSLRTVYRHFPTRDDLLAGASEWIAANYFAVTGLPATPEEVIENLVVNAKLWDEHPELVRAMALTRVGNAVRSVRRVSRLEKLREALLAVSANLSEVERRRAQAVFGYLNNMLAWVTMRDETCLSGEEIGAALRWAMETLIEDLRRRDEAAAQAKKNRRGAGG
jgi:AcrR family transcriptional regulator